MYQNLKYLRHCNLQNYPNITGKGIIVTDSKPEIPGKSSSRFEESRNIPPDVRIIVKLL